jgi:hypothetical protein
MATPMRKRLTSRWQFASEHVQLWNAQLLMAAFDPSTYFIWLPDDIICIILRFLEYSYTTQLVYATPATHTSYFPRGFTYDRCLRASAFMEAFPFANETQIRSWCLDEDIKVYSKRDKIEKKTVSRWVVLKILNTKTYAIQFLRDWILHAYATYANGMKRISIESVEYHSVRERKDAPPPLYAGVDEDYYGDTFKYMMKEWIKNGGTKYETTYITVVTIRLDRNPKCNGFAWKTDASDGAELRRQYQKQYVELLMRNRYYPSDAIVVKRAKLF